MIMKKNILFLTMALLSLAACKREPIPPIGPYYGNTQGIFDDWEVSKVMYVDSTQPVPEIMEATRFFTKDPAKLYSIRFESPDQYSVTNPGMGNLNPLGSSGTFVLTPVDFPTEITFFTDAGDTVGGKLLSLVRPTDPSFGFALAGENCGKNTVAYQYTFQRR